VDGGLIEIDSDGNVAWNKTFGGADYDSCAEVMQTNDSGFIITGRTRSFGSDHNNKLWLIKTNSMGNEEWNRTYGDGVGSSVQQTTDGGYVVAGYSSNNRGWLIKTDFNGIEQWNKTVGSGDGWFGSVCKTIDGGYIVAGGARGPSGFQEVWLVKLKSKGAADEGENVSVAKEPKNGHEPTIINMNHDLLSPQTSGIKITWTADATDPDGDPLLYRFLLSGPRTGNEWQEVKGWSSSNTWVWDTTAEDVGEKNQVAVEVRDGKHAGEESYDDRKESEYYSIKDDLPNTYLAGTVLINGQDYEAYIKTNATFTKESLGRNINDMALRCFMWVN